MSPHINGRMPPIALVLQMLLVLGKGSQCRFMMSLCALFFSLKLNSELPKKVSFGMKIKTRWLQCDTEQQGYSCTVSAIKSRLRHIDGHHHTIFRIRSDSQW